MSAQNSIHSRGETVIGDVFQFDPGSLFDGRREQVTGRSEGRADRDLTGALLRILDKFLEIFPRRLGAGRQNRRGGRDPADRLEILITYVGHAGVIGQVDVIVDSKNRIAIRR